MAAASQHETSPGVETQRLFANLQANLFAVTSDPVRVGRYEIRRRLGEGAMGIVYEAFDPRLRRPIALKLVRSLVKDDPDSRERMLREARSLAALSHPHVLAVTDVGVYRGHVFIGMEFIEGGTLQDWLEQNPPGTPGRTQTLIDFARQSACGLAEAHRHGILHRDFKPANVLIDRQGRLRVADFGLARLLVDETLQQARELPSGPAPGLPLTQTGQVVGTPAYMAPEQFDGHEDIASDQFSWAVTFYEALFGRRPYGGQTIAALRIAMDQRQMRSVPTSGAPASMRRVLRRALQVDPGRRFASMDALLHALSGGSRRSSAVALGGAAMVAALGWGLARSPESQSNLCSGVAARLDEVWDAQAHARVQRSLTADRDELGEETWSRVETILDDYARSWSNARGEVCRAAADSRADAAELEQRNGCLLERRRAFSSLVVGLQRGSDAVVHRAVDAARQLPPIEECLQLTADVRREPVLVESAALALSRAEVALPLAEYREALTQLDQVIASLDPRTQPRALARALYLRAEAHRELGEPDLELESIEGAYFIALEAGDDARAAGAALQLSVAHAESLRRFDSARQWIAHAQSHLQRLDRPSPKLRTMYAMAEGILAHRQGRLDEAEEVYREALDRVEAAGDRERDLARVLTNLANVLSDRGRAEEAVDYIERAQQIDRALYGEHHPRIADRASSLCAVLSSVGRYDAARGHCEEAYDIQLRVFGAEHAVPARTLVNLAIVQAQAGHTGMSISSFEQARSVLADTLGEAHPVVAVIDQNLGTSLVEAGRVEQGVAALRRALESRRAALGDDHPDVAWSRTMLGSQLAGQERWSEARDELQRAVEVFDRIDVLAAPQGLIALAALSRAELGQGQHEQALHDARRAHARLGAGTPPGVAGYVRDGMAHALMAAGQTRQALQEGQLAHRDFVEAGPAHAHDVQEVAAWLREHGVEPSSPQPPAEPKTR